MNALAALVRKDVVLYFLNKRALMITLAAPILIAAFFGAVMGGSGNKPSRVPVAVVDLDASAVTKSIVAAMRSDAPFDLREVDQAAAMELVRKGKVRAAAVFPAGFGEAAPKALFQPRAKKPEVVVYFDPSQAMLRRRFIPPLNVAGRSFARSASPTSSSAAAARSRNRAPVIP